MTEYTVKAYPTEYRGRTYRSRLEARWAAFFDMLGWKHEYEPFDLGKWSPDFLLRGETGGTVLVEVKPITEFDPAVAKEMQDAAWPSVFNGNESSSLVALLLLGTSPHAIGEDVVLGWQGTFWVNPPTCDWQETPIYWSVGLDRPEIYPNLLSIRHSGWGSWRTNDCGPIESLPFLSHKYPDHTMKLWARATGLVQWRPE